MISERDILEAIAECERDRPTYQTCQKLATFYTVLDHLYPEDDVQYVPEASYAAPPAPSVDGETVVTATGESVFMRTIQGVNAQKAWDVMDELMQTVEVLHPRMYDAVIDKLRGL